VGSIQRPKAVRWKLAKNIVWAWIMTLPASALVAGVCYFAIHVVTGG
jgi:PiT family inorganic phosphate transporter